MFFSLAKMQRNAKFKTPYLNILASQHLKRRHRVASHKKSHVVTKDYRQVWST